jgi:hypothetical protein
LQDLGWGEEIAELLRRRFPDITPDEIEAILRQV